MRDVRLKGRVLIAALAAVLPACAMGQAVTVVPNVTSFAGTGAGFYNGDFGAANFVALNGPTAMALDSAGSLYITDTLNNCIRRVDPTSGNMSTVIGLVQSGSNDSCNAPSNPTPTAAEGLYLPAGIAIDANDNLYISDAGHNCVRMLPSHAVGLANSTVVAGTCTAVNGNTTTTAGSVTPRPAGVAMDAAGLLHIAINDGPGGSFQILRHANGDAPTILCREDGDAGSNVIAVCGGVTSTVTLNAPTALTLDALSNLYVADSGNNCIREISGGTTSVAVGTCTGGATSGSAAIVSPGGLAFSSVGELVFSQTTLNMLSSFNPATKVITRVAGKPDGTAGSYALAQNGIGAQSIPLSDPRGVAFDAAGNFYVSDSGNAVVRQFELTQSFGTSPIGAATQSHLLTFTINNPTVSLTVTPGADFAVNQNNCSGTLHGAAATSLSNFCTVTVSFNPTLPGVRNEPLTIADATTGTSVQVGLFGNGSGSQPVFIPGTVASAASGLSHPAAVTADAVGNVYVLSSAPGGGTPMIGRIPAAGGAMTVAQAAGAGGITTPAAIAIDAANNLYVADGVLGTVTRFDANGTAEANYVTGLVSPVAMAVDNNGNLLVTEGGAKHDLLRVLVGGEKIVLAGDGPNATANNVTATAALFAAPSGLAVDANGSIYVGDSAQRRVYVIDSTGVIHFEAGNGTSSTTAPGTALGTALLQPEGLAVDAAGDVYIADAAAQKVYVVFSSTAQTSNLGVLLGTGDAGSTGDGGLATEAKTQGPSAVTTVASGGVFVVDAGNSEVREVSFPIPLIDFGDVTLGNTGTASQTLWNRGNLSFLHTTPPVISSTVFANYAPLTTCGQSVGVGSVCNFGFSFTPTANDPFTGTGTINDTAYNAPQVVDFIGNKGDVALTTFTAPAETETYGKTYTGSVSFTKNVVTTPTGSITFSVNGMTICTANGPFTTGTVTCTKNPSSGLNAGSYTVMVTYSGDSVYPTKSTTTSLTVNKEPLSVVVANQNILVGQPLPTLTGTVTGVIAGDTVQVSYATTAANSNVPGQFPITATVNFVSPTLASNYLLTNTGGTLTVQETTSLGLASSLNPSQVGNAVSFTLTLGPVVAPNTPTGTVTFKDGTTVLCANVPVAAAQAVCTVTTLAQGGHTITATYTSNTPLYTSGTASTVQNVGPPPGSFTVTVTPAAQYIIGAGTTVFQATVVSQGGFNGPVSLACAGLPTDASCVLGNTLVVLSVNGSVTFPVTLKTTLNDAMLTAAPPMGGNMPSLPLYAAATMPLGMLTSLGAFVAGLRRRRKGATLLMVLGVALLALGLSGCGCPTSGVQTFPVTVTGTSVNGGPAPSAATVYLSVALSGR